ncbi:MAG: FAD-dependent oxidoreductase [Chloroflexi bacterium]|nr:FAD-dependent oxidoreductase [Chloroflexota bacterium]
MSDIKVYGAPWCPDCKRAKKFLGEHRVAYRWIDIDTDEEGLRFVEELQNGGRTIPTITFDDGSHLIEPSNDELATKLGLRLTAERGFYDLIIVGGGPTGLTASIYAAREGLDTLVIEKSALGGQAGITQKIDNYPGFPDGIGGGDLADRIVKQAERYDVELLSAVSVASISRDGEDVVVKTQGGDEYCSHALLIATGSTYRRLGAPGEEELIGAGIHFCATCDGPFYKGADELMVIGGGNSALEEGLFLAQFAKKIRIFCRSSRLTASRLLQDKVRSKPMFEIHLNTEVKQFKGKNEISEVVVKDNLTGEETSFHPDAVFVFIGQDPNTSFIGDAVDLDQWGFVVTDQTMQTSMPGVFASGDVRAGSTKQLASAIGEGVTALLMIRQYLEQSAHVAAHVVNA